MKKLNLLQRKMALLSVLLFFVVVLAVPAAVAASDNGGSDVTVQADIVPTPLLMSLNCTWSPWPYHIEWYNTSTLPPLPGSGWASEVVSI